MSEKKAELKDRLYEAMSLKNKKAVDLVNDLKIPKSAVSQYLSGASKNMPSERLYAIAKYLEVSEAWLLGFDFPMQTPEIISKKNNDLAVKVIMRMNNDEVFAEVVSSLYNMDSAQLEGVKALLTFNK